MESQSLLNFDAQIFEVLSNKKYTNRDLSEIAILFGITLYVSEFNTHNTEEQMINEIQRQMIDIVKGDDFNYKQIFKLSKKALFEKYYNQNVEPYEDVLYLYELMLNLMRANELECCLTSNLSSVNLLKECLNLNGIYKTTDDKYFQVHDNVIYEITLKDPTKKLAEFIHCSSGKIGYDNINKYFDGYTRFTQELKFTKDIDKWKKVISHIKALMHLLGNHYRCDWIIKRFVEAIKFFELDGFKFDMLYAELNMDSENTKKSIKEIDLAINN